METFLGLMIGIGLSAACGFRVFIPLLGMSIAVHTGHLALSPGFDWIGSWPALVAFGTATLLELAAYFIPWVDHLMDAVMTPAAVVAGTILTASVMLDVSPFFKWSLAAIAGGGVASLVQVGTLAMRATSSGTTGGLGNPVVSTGEMIASITMTILALLVPILCAVLVIWICIWAIRKFFRSPVMVRTSNSPVARAPHSQ
jgi:hypothetical protein